MKLSIITINYNNLDGLQKTIDSVINQTCQDFEWIIVDGGSSDGSRELIKETAAKLESMGWTTEHFSGPEDPTSFIANQSSITNPSSPHRLSWCSEKDKGIYNAMNKGIVMAQGEFLSFLNSGDQYYTKGTLQRVFESGLGQDILYGACYTPGIEDCVWDVPYSDVNTYKFYSHSLTHQGSFIKRSLFEKFGLYDESLRIVSDWKFFARAIPLGGASVMKLPFTICIQERGGISATQKIVKQKERDIVIKDLFPKMLEDDILSAQSLRQVRSVYFFKLLYSLLYRSAIFWRKHFTKKKSNLNPDKIVF